MAKQPESGTSVDELLKMLSRRNTSSSTTIINSSKGPPVPPKPKRNFGRTEYEVTDRGLTQIYSSTAAQLSSKNDPSSGSRFTGGDWPPNGSLNQPELQKTPDQQPKKPLSPLSVARQLWKSKFRSSSPNKDISAQSYDNQSQENFQVETTRSSASAKPIVTEYSEDTVDHVGSIRSIINNNNNTFNNNNNNEDISRPNRIVCNSTVEIREVPIRQRGQKQASGDKGNLTNISRERQQLYYENNSYTVPVVITTTDDDDEDPSDNDALPTAMEVESILSESSKNQPPRTSTPSSIANDASEVSRSGSSNINIVNNFNGDDDNHAATTDEDMANSSKGTEDEMNVSALNQSGGCELIGVNENSDRSNNSKDSPRIYRQQDGSLFGSPRQVDNSKISPRSSSMLKANNRTLNNASDLNHSVCEQKIQDLEVFVSTLQTSLEKVRSQVSTLTTTIQDLESKLNSSINNNNSIASFCTSRQDQCSPNGNLSSGLSKSTSTINKGQVRNIKNSTATYSRYNSSSAMKGSNKSMDTPKVNRYSSNLSSGHIMSRAKKSGSLYASTNSLYNDKDNRSTPLSPNYQNSTYSPTSMVGTLSRQRDSMPFTSMLSLSSSGLLSTTSTLKNPAAAGSVSNLSQIGTQLASWPSMSNFIQSKHQAKEIIYSEEDRTIRMLLYNNLITMRLPNSVPFDYNLNKVIEPPNVRLKLDWVHGYRGRDCRSNIFYLPTNECVYFIASIVVLYNYEERKQRYYLGHTDSVKCLAVHPNKLIIASGQSTSQSKHDKRPIVRVWNTVSLATLRVIGFNEDFDRSICCLAFSKHDQGATLVVVDESNEHTITLLDWQKEKHWRLAEANSGHEPVLAIDFHPIEKYSLVAVGRSTINFWDVRGMTLTKKPGFFDKYDRPKYVLCLTFNDSGETITGDSNGNIMIWPSKSNRPRFVIHSAHQGGVFSVLAMKDGTYLTGGRDRRIVEWDENFERTGREAEIPEHCGGVRYITYAKANRVLIGTLRNCILHGCLDTNFTLIMQGHTEATSSLAVHPNCSQYLTGGFDEQLHMFDSITHETVWSKCLGMPATAAGFSPGASLIIVGSTLGRWLVIDAIARDIIFEAADGAGSITCVKFSPDGQLFCLGSTDMQVYVYQTNQEGNTFAKIGTCVGHSGPIKEMDWSIENRYLQSQSMNFELLFWDTQHCKPLTDPEILDNLTWATHNCTIGFNAIGLWSDSIDSALVNHCDKSNDSKLMISVTDNGNINIFRWPTCYDQCLSQRYCGNVDKFNFIKFLSDDSKLVAVGAKNCVTTEWVVTNAEP